MKLEFSNTAPIDWKDLQNQVARFFKQAGYRAITPCKIDTARGKVEVDVLVESPDEFVKKILIECKYWDTAVPKEKIHAFRTVVADSGASLGVIITKTGFQSGAIEAAKYSNIQLLTWNEFLSLIESKWILNELKELKRKSFPLYSYINLKFPIKDLLPEDLERYRELEPHCRALHWTCWKLSKTDLLGEMEENGSWYRLNDYSSIEAYVSFLFAEVEIMSDNMEKIVQHSNVKVVFPQFNRDMEGVTNMYLE